ncbi:uncharacterized protein J4E88_003570 [Alternaria novae-zelandiae]|uniref:uncharacterized protein n=1 Tax=Alternaria novae-zelandiae TaxID=430562 RepID=UPI0020C2A0EE|nr:uncharacterized protein J4E88_003570 [Alternaria novae-zelandiae]KAI4685735.1 hypothetical protein J4E88_003570 [Alternaria novae-zelandiae]
MSSTEQDVGSNDNSDKDRAIIKPSEGTCGILPDTDIVTVDEEVAEDQEMEDSYVFVEADYHSYTDVESSVAEGSNSDCELSEREEKGDVNSKSEADRMEEQNGGVRKGFVKGAAEKKTSGTQGDGGKDDAEELPEIAKLRARTVYSLLITRVTIMPRPEKPHMNDDINSQEDFTQLVDGKKVVALPNDTPPRHPDGSYVFVRDETAKTIEDKSAQDTIAYYAKILAIETKSRPYPSLTSNAILDGLDTLRICSEIFSDNPTKPAFVAEYLHMLEPQHQLSLSIVLSIILDPDDWMNLEHEVVRDEEFEISVVIWALKLGPEGLMLGRVEGRSEMQILLAAEEAWIVVNEGKEEYEEKKMELRRVAAEVTMWGRGAAGMFAKKGRTEDDD